MRNLIILFAVLVIASSCEKEVPKPRPMAINPADTLNWNLYLSITYKNQTYNLYNLKPYKVNLLTNCEPPYYQTIEVGRDVYFKNDSNINVHFLYYYGVGIKRVSGNINGHPFISNYDCNNDSTTINICNSTQNLPIYYNLFYKGNSGNS